MVITPLGKWKQKAAEFRVIHPGLYQTLFLKIKNNQIINETVEWVDGRGGIGLIVIKGYRPFELLVERFVEVATW